MTQRQILNLDSVGEGPVYRELRGIGQVRVEVLTPGDSVELADRYFERPIQVDYQRFVSALIARMVTLPELSFEDAEALPQSQRASLRIAIAEAAGVLPAYQRLSGTMLSGDERLFAVLYEEHRRIGEVFSAATRVLADSVPKLIDAIGRGIRPPRADVGELFTHRGLANSKQISELMNLPAIREINRAQADLVRPEISLPDLIAPWMADEVARVQRRLTASFKPHFEEMLRRSQETMRRVVQDNALNPAQKALQDLVDSPSFKAWSRQAREITAKIGSGIARGLEGSMHFLNENWVELQGYPAQYPPPALYVLAFLPMGVGLPLARTIRDRDDERLISLLEPVLTNPELVDRMQAATEGASLLSPVAKQHFRTAFGWLRVGAYVNAYPPFYQALESGLREAARQGEVIDEHNRFLVETRTSKARKIEDVFPHLPLTPRYRRFLLSWIFGEVGNPFRHGDISDPEECRNQALLLAMATIGWLETFGSWEKRQFRLLLSSEAISERGFSAARAA